DADAAGASSRLEAGGVGRDQEFFPPPVLERSAREDTRGARDEAEDQRSGSDGLCADAHLEQPTASRAVAAEITAALLRANGRAAPMAWLKPRCRKKNMKTCAC